MIRFIHLADVHLGAVPDRGCPWSREREEEIWETFRRVIVGIRKNPVDLLFIAGDLFHRQPLLRELREVDDLFASVPDTRVGSSIFLKEFIEKAPENPPIPPRTSGLMVLAICFLH